MPRHPTEVTSTEAATPLIPPPTRLVEAFYKKLAPEIRKDKNKVDKQLDAFIAYFEACEKAQKKLIADLRRIAKH